MPPSPPQPPAPRDQHEAVAHLDPPLWQRASRRLLSKAIAEFSHERLLQPRISQSGEGVQEAVLSTPDGRVDYRFQVRRYALEHWQIDAASLQRHVAGQPAAIDVPEFLLEFSTQLGLAPPVLPVYLEEINSTLAAMCYQLAHPAAAADQLADADFQTIEVAMSEGHPAFVANHGRVGFGLDDYRRYAPEAAAPQPLLWLAVHRRRASFHALDDAPQEALLEQELSDSLRQAFNQRIAAAGGHRQAYLLLPVHPWQWQYKLATAFAGDLAHRDIIYLGPGEDHYRPQQSIRTWFNCDHPERAYVKTALSILNMGFMRGLSAEYMRDTPAINQWLAELIRSDPQLQALGFDILREFAAIGYRPAGYHPATDRSSPYRKMLAALWRESPIPRLAPGQRLMTMAALLHVDAQGQTLLAALVRRAGISPERWLEGYLQAYLTPLLHCFYAYGLVFMPHGENVILVLEQAQVSRVLLKDIGEEIAVMAPTMELPPAVRRIAVQVPESLQTLSIFTDICDGFLRFMAPLMDIHLGLPEARFWALVATTIRRQQQAHPEQAARHAACDLFAPHFPHSCLNRLQLKNNQQMVDLADPTGSLQMAGELANPLAHAL